MDIVFDRFHVFDVLFDRIAVIEAQVAAAFEFGGDPKIEADGLGMADMQIAIGLRRETGGHPPIVFSCFLIFDNDISDEIWCGAGLVLHCL